jgi:hypothetical protein
VLVSLGESAMAVMGAEGVAVRRWWSGGWLCGLVFVGGGIGLGGFVPGVAGCSRVLSEGAVIVVVVGLRECLAWSKGQAMSGSGG